MKAYLEILETTRPKRGRKRTRESIEKRIRAIETEREAANPLKKVQLIQEHMDLNKELILMEDPGDLAAKLVEAEAGFVEYGKSYSDRKGISYAAWREFGVPAPMLKKAGISRGG